MPSSGTRPQAHLRLWQRFHDALVRDAQRLARLLSDGPDIATPGLTTWWDRFAPAVTQCVQLTTKLSILGNPGAPGGAGPTPSTPLSEAVEAMGLAVGTLPAAAETNPDGGGSAACDRVELVSRARGLVGRHAADSVDYLTRAITPDAYRVWERGAIARLTYLNVSFLAPWLLDELSLAGRDVLRRDVPHIRVMRCDDMWIRRYQAMTEALWGPRV